MEEDKLRKLINEWKGKYGSGYLVVTVVGCGGGGFGED